MAPSLPVDNPNLSHWHRTTRSFPHLHENQKNNVPASSKYVIIGSGITGALTAWQLLNSGVPGRDIVILEAREAVTGATGKNAGHCRPDAFNGFPKFSAKHGPQQARKIIESEKVVLELVNDFVKKHKVDCDFQYTTTIEVCLGPTHVDHLAQAFAAYKSSGGDVSHIKFYEQEEARARSRVHKALCAYEWQGGCLHPVKLCHWILSDIIRQGGQFYTHCPATKVARHQRQSGQRWDVYTPRGVIAAETVVHCTNAWAAFLIPELAGVVTPRRAQGHSYVPPASLSGANVFKSTMSLRYGTGHYFSFNQQKDGTVILGGLATRDEKDLTPEVVKDKYTDDDTKHNAQLVENSVAEFAKLCGPAVTPARAGEGLSHVWTGIIGETPDSVPLIGPVPDHDGQWICAGFNGHGMARIFLCAPGLAKLISGEDWSATGMPECFQISQERLGRLAKSKSKL